MMPLDPGFDAEGHLNYVQYLLSHKSIPLANEGWETHQPPLFYLVSAIFMPSSQLPLAQTNTTYSLKFIPFLSGIGQIFLAYFAARMVFPNSKTKQSLSVAIAALIPMNIYISSYFSNESSSAFLMSLAILVTIIILNSSRSSSRQYLILGLVIGLALLTKFTVLSILPVIFLVILYKLFFEEKCPVTKIGWNLGLMFIVIVLIAGWFYVRNWIHFGKIFVCDFGHLLTSPWWQDPGFHTYKYFCQFGKVFTMPCFAGTYSFFDSIYSTFWGDGFLGGVPYYIFRPPWNYEYMSAVYLLAIPATVVIIIGMVCAIGNMIRTVSKIWLLILGSIFTIAYSIVYMNLQVPYYGQAKAFFGLGAILPISLIFALGFDYIDNLLRGKKLFILRMVLYGWFGALILTIFLSMFITPNHVIPCLDLDTLAKRGKLSNAVTYYTQLLRNEPNNWDTHYELANAYFMQRKYNDAIEHYKTTIQLRPMWPDALNNLAVALINKPNAASADKALAVQYAELSCQLTGYLNIRMVSNLADAYAAAEQPAQAITAAEKVIKLATSAGLHGLAEETQKWLQQYKMQQTYSKPPP
jgi:hypothetical protein